VTRYSIKPVEVGRRKADSALFLYLTDFGIEIEIAYRLWILRSADGLIVVDTGPPLEEAHRRGITEVRDIDAALDEAGVKGTDVRTIVLTHLHWDHAANAGKFPNAVYLAQRSEIEFFHSHAREHPAMNRFFSHQAYLAQLIDEGRIRPVDGDQPIAPGIRAIRVGGHTPGSQMLIVDTADGTAVITGDAIPLHRNYIDNIPSGIVVNAVEAIAALERVRALRPVAIFTAHDLQPCMRLA
jgi:glyoxylase-like metal-dependent hydrolase (beta-lactamase superfamily II)